MWGCVCGGGVGVCVGGCVGVCGCVCVCVCWGLIFIAGLFESPAVSEKSQQIPGIADITVTVPGVKKLLKDIKSHKAAGPDVIPGRVFSRVCR